MGEVSVIWEGFAEHGELGRQYAMRNAADIKVLIGDAVEPCSCLCDSTGDDYHSVFLNGSNLRFESGPTDDDSLKYACKSLKLYYKDSFHLRDYVESSIDQAYARFAGAPLKIHKITNPWRSPAGVLPALKTKEEETISMPNNIIIHLRKQKYNADYDLSAKEGADTLAFMSLLEEKLLPAMIYAQWVDSKNYVDVTRRWYAEHISFPLNFVLPNRMHKQQLEKLRLLRGDSTLEPGESLERELYRDATECMTLLSQRLGSQKFFFGDSPSSLDAYVFGHLAPLLKIKLPNGKLQQHLHSLENLKQFCTSILLLYFPSTGQEHTSHKTSVHSEGGEGDSEPYKRRNQILSALFAFGAMLGYAVFTGIISIERVQPEMALRSSSHAEDEEMD